MSRLVTSDVRLVPSGKGRQDLALPAELIDKALGFATKARSKRTLEEYGKIWRAFEAWCAANSRTALPAAIETLAGYLTTMATNGRSTPYMALLQAAIKFRHEAAGEKIDTKDPALQLVWSGIRREVAKTRTTRRVSPVLNTDLSELLELLNPTVPRQARDAAILALGWSGALRRSELVGLDYHQLGTSPDPDETRKGFITISEEEIVITLMTSKASQDAAQTVVIPAMWAPRAVKAVANWVTMSKVRIGDPLFRGVTGSGWSLNKQSGYPGVSWREDAQKWRAQITVNRNNQSLGLFKDPYEAHVAYAKAKLIKPAPRNGGTISPHRMHTDTVADLIRLRVSQLAKSRKKRMTRAEVAELAKAFSGHSLRAGYATSAAQEGLPSHRIRQQTRHKSEGMLNVYIREVDVRKNSGLKGVGV